MANTDTHTHTHVHADRGHAEPCDGHYNDGAAGAAGGLPQRQRRHAPLHTPPQHHRGQHYVGPEGCGAWLLGGHCRWVRVVEDAGGKGCGPHSSHNWHGCSSETMDGGHFKWNGLQFDAARAASRKTSVLSSLKGNYTHIQEACTHMPASSHCKSQTCRRTCPGPTGGHPHARRLPGSAVFHCRHFQEPAGPGAASRCSSYQRFCHAHVAKIACLTFPKAAPLHEDHKAREKIWGGMRPGCREGKADTSVVCCAGARTVSWQAR
eukprot:1160124-Pelagomonas_calceolata.AAC.5